MMSQSALAARHDVCAKIEELLTSLRGIREARVTMNDGRISQVQVSASAKLSDRQIVRNVTSAIVAVFGYEVDANDVEVHDDLPDSIAAIAAPTVIRALPSTVRALPAINLSAGVPVPTPAVTVLPRDNWGHGQDPLSLSELSITSLSGGRLRCRAVLSGAQGMTIGEVETIEEQRLESIARAVIVAGRAQMENAVFELDAIRVMDSAGQQVALALVRLRETSDPHRLAGAEMIAGNIDLAAARATVAALNRISIHE